jgi:hypothetical protein
VGLGLEKYDQGTSPTLDNARAWPGGRIWISGRLSALGEEAVLQVCRIIFAILFLPSPCLACTVGWLLGGKPSEQGLNYALLLYIEIERLADYAAPRPDDMVVGGDDLVRMSFTGIVLVRVPSVVPFGAVFIENRLGNEILQRRGRVQPEGP